MGVLGQTGKGYGASATAPGHSLPPHPQGLHDQLLNSNLDPSEVEKAKEGQVQRVGLG